MSHGSDGDPPHLRAMKQRLRFFPAPLPPGVAPDRFDCLTVPNVPGPLASEALSVLTWRATLLDGRELFVPRLQFQDFMHLLNKLMYVDVLRCLAYIRQIHVVYTLMIRRCRTRLRKGCVRFGDHLVNLDPLRALLQRFGEGILGGLREADLDGVDVMNVKASERIVSMVCITHLLQQGDAASLRAALYIWATRAAVFAFVDPSLTLLIRVYYAFYAMFFFEGLQAATKAQLLRTAERGGVYDRFITSNSFSCIRLNAKNLLLLLSWICKLPADLRASYSFAPWVRPPFSRRFARSGRMTVRRSTANSSSASSSASPSPAFCDRVAMQAISLRRISWTGRIEVKRLRFRWLGLTASSACRHIGSTYVLSGSMCMRHWC